MCVCVCVCVFNLHAQSKVVSPLGTSQTYVTFTSVVLISPHPRRQVAISGDIFGCHNLRCYQRLVSRDWRCCLASVKYRTAPYREVSDIRSQYI